MGCGVVAILSPVLTLPLNLTELFLFPFWPDIFRGILKHPDALVLAAEFCLVILSFIIQLIAVIYLALSVGHLFSRHRKLAGTAAFIGL